MLLLYYILEGYFTINVYKKTTYLILVWCKIDTEISCVSITRSHSMLSSGFWSVENVSSYLCRFSILSLLFVISYVVVVFYSVSDRTPTSCFPFNFPASPLSTCSCYIENSSVEYHKICCAAFPCFSLSKGAKYKSPLTLASSKLSNIFPYEQHLCE